MDENLGYSSDDDEDRRQSSSQWHLAHDSLISLERDTSKLFFQYENYHLHLIQKREPPSAQLIIPATKCERLCYFRNYVSSPNKTQIASMHQMTFNKLLWQYVMNTLYKSLQHTYVNIFLASYVPENHLFLSKMVPWMHGIKYCLVLTGLLEVTTCIATTIILFDYLVGSIFLKNPWNRCPKGGEYHYHYGPDKDLIIKCYNILDFGKRVKNKTVIFHKRFYYIPEDNELLQLVQVEYFKFRSSSITNLVKFIYTCIIWLLIGFCYKQIFKKPFWKIFNIVHWCVIAIDVSSFAYVVFYKAFCAEDFTVPNISYNTPTIVTHAFSFSDLDFLAESTTAPPVVHVLTARSTQEILPGRDSAIIIISNAVCFLFRALLSYKVKQHCENLINVPILLPGTVANAWLYFWPMFFSTFFLGEIFTLLFLLFHFIMELMTCIVTFQCLVEAAVTEWSSMQRWFVTSILISIGLVFMTTVPVDMTFLLTYSKSTVTLIECIVLYWMYPVYRLVDDIFFHYGSPPHPFRVNLLFIVPFYYLNKYYTLINITVTMILPHLKYKDKYFVKHTLICSLSFIIIPILCGAVYITYKNVWKERRGWKSMFAPAVDWGPRDYNTRQLRKEFDSRIYNSSEAPRNLSHHIFGRANSKTYRLDIRYDSKRRSTVPISEYNMVSEKV